MCHEPFVIHSWKSCNSWLAPSTIIELRLTFNQPAPKAVKHPSSMQVFPVRRRNCYGERMPETRFPEAGDVVEVTTDRLAYGGEAVARYQGLAIFVPFGAPGERLRVRITEIKKNFARGVIEEILGASPARREARC